MFHDYFGDYISQEKEIGADMQNETLPMIRRTRFKTMKRNPLAMKLRAKQKETLLKISKKYGSSVDKKAI